MLPEVLRTSRLTLRPWSVHDTAAVLTYASDEEWGRYLPIDYPYSEAAAEAFVASQLALDRVQHFAWALEYEERAMGGLNLALSEGGRIAEIDYALARALWGRGLMTEAVTAIVEGCGSSAAS